MAVAVGEAHHLVLDRRAVARSGATDAAGEHRRAVEPGGQHLMGCPVGEGDVTTHLRQPWKAAPVGAVGERRRARVARLLAGNAEVDAGAPQPWRGAGLEPAALDAEALKRLRQPGRGALAEPAPRGAVQPREQHAVQEGAGCDHQCAAADLAVPVGRYGGDPGIAHRHPGRHRLHHGQAMLLRHHALRRGRVGVAIRLAARRPDRRPLGAVQQAELNAGGVRELTHHAAEGVDFVHQVPLGGAADRRIARHAPDRRRLAGDQTNRTAHARRRQRRFDAGVTAAYDNEIEHRMRVKNTPRQTDRRPQYPAV